MNYLQNFSSFKLLLAVIHPYAINSGRTLP